MKKIVALSVLLLFGGGFTACDPDSEIEIKHATGTFIGSYANGFGSFLIQVDEDYPIGKVIEYIENGSCITLPEAGTYLNMIQVQINGLSSDIMNKKISFSYRAFQAGQDDDLFRIGTGLGNTLCAPPDIPIYVIIDYQ